MVKIEEHKEEEEEVETIGTEKPPIFASGSGFGTPVDESGKVGPYFVLTFYFDPPETDKHIHAVVGRFILDWGSGEEFAKSLREFLDKNKPK